MDLEKAKAMIPELRALPAEVGDLNAQNYCAAWQRCSDMRGDDGEVLGNIPHTLIVPPQLKMTGHEIVIGQFLAAAPRSENPMRGSTDMVWIPSIKDQPKRWYIVGDRGAVAMEAP